MLGGKVERHGESVWNRMQRHYAIFPSLKKRIPQFSKFSYFVRKLLVRMKIPEPLSTIVYFNKENMDAPFMPCANAKSELFENTETVTAAQRE
jgi:hypothetical protein